MTNYLKMPSFFADESRRVITTGSFFVKKIRCCGGLPSRYRAKTAILRHSWIKLAIYRDINPISTGFSWQG